MNWKRFQKDGSRFQELDDLTGPGLTNKDVKELMAACPDCGRWKTRRTSAFHECPEVIDLTTDEADDTDEAV
jgi:hypothetical protein